MAHTLMLIFLFFVILVLPCVVASCIDMEEEEEIADYKQRGASSFQRRVGPSSQRDGPSSS